VNGLAVAVLAQQVTSTIAMVDEKTAFTGGTGCEHVRVTVNADFAPNRPTGAIELDPTDGGWQHSRGHVDPGDNRTERSEVASSARDIGMERMVGGGRLIRMA